MNIADFKAQYPDYKDIPDLELAEALHAKFYGSMDRDEFMGTVGVYAPKEAGAGRGTAADPRRLDLERGSAPALDTTLTPQRSVTDSTAVITRPKSGSVLDQREAGPDSIDAQRANEVLSKRRGAEMATDPALLAPQIGPVRGKLITPTDGGILSRGMDLAGANMREAAAGAATLAADAVGAVGADGAASTLRRAATGTRRMAQDAQLSNKFATDVAQADPFSSGLEKFGQKYGPQIAAQMPQIGMAMLTGGIALPATITAFGGYDTARERGLDPVNAVVYALGQGTAEALGEKVGGMGKLASAFEDAVKAGFGRNALSTLGRRMASAGLKEVPSELATFTGQFGIDMAAGFEKNDSKLGERFIEGAKDTAIVAAGAGGMMGAAGGAMSIAGGRKPAQPIPTAREMLEQRWGIQKTPEQTAAPVLAAGSVDEAISAAQRETSAPLPAAVPPAQVTAITPSAAAQAANPQASAAVDRIAEILGQPQETVNASNPVGAAGQPAGGGGLGGAVDVGGLDDRGLQPGVTGGGRGLPAAEPVAGGAAPVAAGVGAAGAGALIPQTVWFGRRGDGYATAQDAEAALPSRQRARADLDWKVEPTPEGRFRLAGYGDPGAAPAQTTAQGFRLAMNPTGTLTVQGDPNAIRAVLQAAGVDKVAVSPSGVMVGVSQAQQAMQVLDPQVRETTERIQALERAAPQTAPQAAPALESADSRFPPGSMPQAVPAQVPPQPAGAPEIGRTAPPVQDMQAAPPAAPAEVPAEPQFKATLNPSGTLTIKGDPEAIKAILKDAGITGVRRADGVLVGKSQAQAAQKLPALQTSGAERAEADRRTEEDTRARADAQRDEFTLQGSDRAAEANPAQQDAFDADMRAKPFDHGELNIPGRTNRIDADLDRYKAEQARTEKVDAKQATAKRKTDKARAKEVFAEAWPAMLEKMGPKFGEKQLRETLDSMVKWEPAKFLAMAEKFRKEQGGKDAFDSVMRHRADPRDELTAKQAARTAEVQKVVDELSANWTDGPDIEVVATVADLIAATGSHHPADTRGMYQRGRVWIVADAYAHGSRKGIAKTLAHEAVAHYGLRDMLGRQDWTQLMDRIQLGIKTKNKPLTSLRDRVREAYRDEDGGYSLSPEQEADEIAALAVEEAIDSDGNFRPGFSMFKAVFAKVAQFLRDLGIDIAFTNAELQGMLVLSMRGLQVGERTAGGGRMVLGGSPAARARTGARAVAAWQEVTETEFGPEYTRDGLQLLPLGEKDTSTDLAENSLPLGHAAHVEDGNKVYDFAIARDGELVGRATLEVGADGQIAAVHDIVVDGRRNGVGRAVMEAVLASAKDSVRIIDIVPAAEAFWDKMGSGARDVYANATADWQTYEAARPQPRGEGRGARNDAQAEQGRPGKGDAATEGEDEGFDGTLRARAGVQADPVGGTSQDEDGWQMPEATRGDRVLYELQDGRIDLRRAVEAIKASGREIEERFDARQAETLFPGRVAYRSQTFLEQEVKPLLTFMAANRVKIDEISDYLIARHAPERNAQVAKVNPDMPDGGAGRNSEGTLMTTKAAEEYLAGIDPARSKVLESTAARIDAITAGTRQILVQEGLEKPGVVGAWESAYKFYAPLFKDEADAGTPHPIGTGFTIKGPASKRATGSTRQVTDVLGHVLMQREAAITRAEKNRVGMSLYGMVLAYPNPDFWVAIRPGMAKGALRAQLTAMGVDPDEVTAAMDGVPTVRTVDEKTNKVVERPNPLYKSLPGAIVLKVAGEDRVIMFNQKDQRAMRLADSMKNLDGLTKLDIAGSLIGKATRWIASVNTQYNPVFGFVNVVRDLQNGIVNLTSTQLSGHKAEILGNVPAALIGIARDLRDDSKRTEWSDLFVRFQDAGGKTGYRELFRDAADRTKEIERELKQLDAAGSLSIGRGAHAVLDLLDDFNTALENAVRLSAFKAGLDAGISEAESARIARELTVDFNRRGRTGREIGPLYAFFNASMQGTARTIATLKGPAGAKIIAGGVAIGIMQALMLAAAGFEDDDLPEFIKTRNLIIPTAWRSDRKTYIAIPLGLGLHVLPNTGRILTEIVLGGGKRLGRKLQDALGEIVGAFNPMGSANPFTLDGALKTAAPTVVDPIIELGFNKNFAGGQIQRQPFSEEGDNRPGFTRARESTQRSTTGQVYLGISKAINAATGGSAYEAGLASPTPEAVRYLAQVAGGGVLREFEKSVNAIADAAAGRPVKLNAIPLTGRFFGEVDSDAVETRRYFDAKNRISKAQSSLKAAERAGDREEYRRILRKTAELSHYEALQETQRSISALNKLAVENVSDPVRAKQIDAARISEMRELNEALRRLEARPPAKVD